MFLTRILLTSASRVPISTRPTSSRSRSIIISTNANRSFLSCRNRSKSESTPLSLNFVTFIPKGLKTMSLSTTGKKNVSAGEQSSGAQERKSSSPEAGDTTKASKDNVKKEKDQDGPNSSGRYKTRGFMNKHKVDENKEKFLSMDIESKRKLYKCKKNYTTLSNVQVWPDYFQEHLVNDRLTKQWMKENKKKPKEVNKGLNKKMSLFRGDITTLEIDAIVNAANESLLGGGGVDGAIHSAAGKNLVSECSLIGGCNAGDAKITCGYELPAKYVVHTVGPRGKNPGTLESCYVQSLSLLKEKGLKSIAFPCISTGIFGYPNEDAANVALSAMRDWLEKEEYAQNVERIIMCLFLQKDVDIYHRLMQFYFPVGEAEDSNNSSQTEEESLDSTSKENEKLDTLAEKSSKTVSESKKD